MTLQKFWKSAWLAVVVLIPTFLVWAALSVITGQTTSATKTLPATSMALNTDSEESIPTPDFIETELAGYNTPELIQTELAILQTPIPAPTDWISIEFYEPGVRGSAIDQFDEAVLTIGDFQFTISGIGNRSSAGILDVRGFAMSPLQFEALIEGNSVRYGGRDYGPFDKSKLFYEPSFRDDRQTTISSLVTLRASLVEPQEIALVDEAINHLTASLAPELWADPLRLQPRASATVFTEDRAALQSLMQLPSEHPGRDYVSDIIFADHALAIVAIDDAALAGADQQQITEAMDQLPLGYLLTGEGEPVKILEAFQDTWQQATEAMSGPTPTATIDPLELALTYEYVPLPPPEDVVVINFYYPLGFPVKNSGDILKIGQNTYWYCVSGKRYNTSGPSFRNVMGCIIPISDFATLEDGLEIEFNGQNFGVLDKDELMYEIPIRSYRQELLEVLSAKLPNATNSQEAAILDEIISRLESTLASEYWLDDLRLKPQSGDFIFAEDTAIINLFNQLPVDPTNTVLVSEFGLPSDVIRDDFVRRLVRTALVSVAAAMDDAVVAGGDLETLSAVKESILNAESQLNDPYSPQYETALSALKSAQTIWREIIAARPTATPTLTKP